MIKAKFSTNYWAVQSRIRRLPRLMIKQMRAHARRDARAVIQEFRRGIAEDSLRLRRLRPKTIERKEGKGFEQPDTPLYGLGFADKRSYVNMLHVVHVGQRMFVVRPKAGYHHGKRYPGDPDPKPKTIKLKDLFDVHEYGTIIHNAFGRGLTVRIPPRPALRFAYRRYLRRRAKEDPAAAVRAAIAKYIQAGDTEALIRIHKKMERGFETLGGKRLP